MGVDAFIYDKKNDLSIYYDREYNIITRTFSLENEKDNLRKENLLLKFTTGGLSYSELLNLLQLNLTIKDDDLPESVIFTNSSILGLLNSNIKFFQNSIFISICSSEDQFYDLKPKNEIDIFNMIATFMPLP